MPNAINLPPPTQLHGNDSSKIQQLYAYLYNLSERMNQALTQVGNGRDVGAIGVPKQSTAASAASDRALTPEELARRRAELKALIIKTADRTSSEVQREIEELEDAYAAEGDFGEYLEQHKLYLEKTARETIESYTYKGILLSAYLNAVTETDGYIKHGFIYEDELGVPVLGIAISQEYIVTTEVVIDDETYTQIDTSDKYLMFLTSDKLEFYINGVRKAYFRTDEAFVENLKITNIASIRGIINEIAEEISLSATAMQFLADAITISADHVDVTGKDINFSAANSFTLSAEQMRVIGSAMDISTNGTIQLIAGKVESTSNILSNVVQVDQDGAHLRSAAIVDGEVQVDRNASSVNLSSRGMRIRDPLYKRADGTPVAGDDLDRWIATADKQAINNTVIYDSANCSNIRRRKPGEVFD